MIPPVNSEFEPRLAKPGAGLPFIEWFVAKYLLFPKRFKSTSPEEGLQQFRHESELILNLVTSIRAEQLSERRLVPRLRGLEDSSRYWSVAMTVEHLVIVGQRMNFVVTNLSMNNTNLPTASISEVKPPADLDPERVIADFKTMTDQFCDVLNSHDVDQYPEAKYAHPWFGPLTARQWLLFAAPHQGIHRAQIEEIIKRL